MKYTEQHVKDAHLAEVCINIARAEGTTGREEAVRDIVTFGDDNQIDEKATRKLRAAELRRFENGRRILKGAELVYSRRKMRGTAGEEIDHSTVDSPVITVSAGHIAASEAVRYVALRIK